MLATCHSCRHQNRGENQIHKSTFLEPENSKGPIWEGIGVACQVTANSGSQTHLCHGLIWPVWSLCSLLPFQSFLLDGWKEPVGLGSSHDMPRVTVAVRQVLTHVAGAGISRKAVFFLSRGRASLSFRHLRDTPCSWCHWLWPALL